MPDQQEQRKASALAKDVMLFGTRLGLALASGQPWVIANTLLDLADQHTERLKHIEGKIDKIHTKVLTLLYTDYKSGYYYLRMARDTKGRKRRQERFKTALDFFVKARQNVPLPLERVDAILHIGICHLLLGEERLAKKCFREACTELQNLQDALTSHHYHRFAQIDGTLVERQALPTRLGRALGANESKTIVSQINSEIAGIRRLEKYWLWRRMKTTGIALATTGAAGLAWYILRRHGGNDQIIR